MLLAAAVLDAPDDPSGRGLLMVVAAVLVLLVVTVHVRLLLRVAPRDVSEVERDDERAVDEGSAGGRSAGTPSSGPSAPEPASPTAAPAAPAPASSREPVDAGLS